MNSRTTLLLAGVFLILGAYIYFVELQKPAEKLPGAQPPRPAPQVFNLPDVDINRLEIRNLKRAQTITLVRISGAWQIEGATAQPADTNKLNDIVSGFKILQASRVFTDVTDLSQYGVLTGTLEARMTSSDNKSYAITVGNKLPAGDSYYAIYTGSDKPLFVMATTLVDEWLTWFDKPPLQPTPVPTPTSAPSPTAAPLLTPTVGATPKP